MDVPREIEEALSSAPPKAQLCFVLDWNLDALLPDTAALSGRRARKEAISEAVSAVKAPVLSALRDRPSIDVNDSGGAGQTVVAATADQWRAILDHPAVKNAEARILPNALFSED
ncbi:MAG: hypothetical protein JOZ90_09410 [Alphaproteobacteria bacterium]|nr:hypothetical protein [Alphaproteobacteria bacterium]MBV9371855.1 hypothetical protein [Alphaproteobacteria bacterium]MBV9901302.1 hypothetical protein [Alphaproteobacteria bacterium]